MRFDLELDPLFPLKREKNTPNIENNGRNFVLNFALVRPFIAAVFHYGLKLCEIDAFNS